MRKRRNQTDDALRRALCELAQEEAGALARALERDELPVPAARVDELAQRHRPAALALIRRHTARTPRAMRRYALCAAACLVLVAAGLSALTRPAPDRRYAPAPTLSPFQPVATGTPLATPLPTSSPTLAPTGAPSATPAVTAAPTPAATASPTATATPTPTPAITPTPAVTATPTPALNTPAVPDGWTGSCFPRYLPAGYALERVEQAAGKATAVYYGAQAGDVLTFTEHDEPTLYPGEGGAYVTVTSEAAGLMTAAEGAGATLVFDLHGRTFAIHCSEGAQAALAVARSIAPLGGE